MDCWEILDIERFSDKKTIKIAYAKQLKLHRPDDDPKGFEQIHRAYKSALSWIPAAIENESAWNNSGRHNLHVLDRTDEPSDQALVDVIMTSLQRPMDEIATNSAEKPKSVAIEDQPDLTDSIWQDELSTSPTPELSEADRQLLDEIHGQEYLLREDWQRLCLKVSDIIKSKQHCNDLDAWKFLEALTSMSDLEFRKAASDQVFEVVSEVNSVSLDNKHLHIKRAVLNYLNKLFSWDKKWQEYQTLHSRKMLNAIYPYLEEAEKPVKGISKKRELYYYRRGAAFAIDLSLLMLVVPIYAVFEGLLNVTGLQNWWQQLGFNAGIAFVIWLIVYLAFLVPFQESSRHQATIGKRLLSLQVIDKRGDRIGFFQSFWRSLVTLVCCFGFKVAVFINIILSYWRSEILQDTLSKSYVILRPGYSHK